LFAVSYFEDHARLLGIINTVEAIINAVSKPFIAKLADMTSRQTAYCFLLVLYVVGYIVIATSQNGIALAVGRIISTVGQAGLDLVTDIIVADLTPLEWRGFFTALTSMPYIWFAWIGPEISGPIIRNSLTGWRWGFGMFAIIVPACVLPAALLLFWADRRAQKSGELRVAESLFERRWRDEHPDSPIPGKWHVFLHWCREMDVIGLFLIGWAWALLLLPFSLAPKAEGRWSNRECITGRLVRSLMGSLDDSDVGDRSGASDMLYCLGVETRFYSYDYQESD
jgi:MFS family permease